MKKKKEKKTLAQQVNELDNDLLNYWNYYDPEKIGELLKNVESRLSSLEGEDIDFIELQSYIYSMYRSINDTVENLDKIEEFKQRLDSLQAEIEEAYSKMTPEEIGNNKDIRIISDRTIDKINNMKNNINIQNIRQKVSEFFRKYEIIKKEIDVKADEQRQRQKEQLIAEVKEEILSNEGNDKWGYVYRVEQHHSYADTITCLAPGTKKEVELGNKYGIGYEKEAAKADYCFDFNSLETDKLTQEQQYAIQREKEIRAQQLADYKEHPEKYSEPFFINVSVRDVNDRGQKRYKEISVPVTKGELIEAGLNPDRVALQRESVSSKDIAKSTKGIGEKLKLGLRRAWDKLRTRGQDDKNNDGREDI